MARYEHALVVYHERRFAEALELMQQCATERNDPIAALYTMRCAKLLQRPPPGDWDGVWTEAEPAPAPADRHPERCFALFFSTHRFTTFR